MKIITRNTAALVYHCAIPAARPPAPPLEDRVAALAYANAMTITMPLAVFEALRGGWGGFRG